MESDQAFPPTRGLRLTLELEDGPLPSGHLSGDEIDVEFSGWMQLLAAIESALGNRPSG